MFVLNILVLILLGWLPVHTLVRYCRGKDGEQRPGKGEIAGILLSTVGMLVYVALLMYFKHVL